jgi:hypothetical protein
MGYIKQVINVFNDDTATDILPVNSIVYMLIL